VIFVDASAVVAILTGEEGRDALADALEAGGPAITSAVAVFEAALGIRRKRHASVAEAHGDVNEFLKAASVRVVPISVREAEIALDAFARYGKGTGHPAQLNLGDCFAYAVARNYGASLLFKGDDFAKTDISPAV
jgi:ribonuclease VapC